MAARYMIPPKAVSLTTLPGAFIIVFMILMLPFFAGWEMGWGWAKDNLPLALSSAAVLSLAAALWVSRWVEKSRAGEYVELDEQGITSTFKLLPASAELSREYRSSPKDRQRPRRVFWSDVRSVELTAVRTRHMGKHYQLCLVTDDDVMTVPLNARAFGYRPLVEVDSSGRELRISDAGRYPGSQIVEEVRRHAGEAHWTVKEVREFQHRREEKELAFSGIDNPWSGESVSESGGSGAMSRRLLILAIAGAVFIAMLVFGILFYTRRQYEVRRKRDKALQEKRTRQLEEEIKEPAR